MLTEHPGATPVTIAAHIADALRAAIAARGQASLAVSGGKSPIPMFEALREQDLDWSKVTVVLVDERVVPRDHAASNTALVAQHLLQGPAAQARFLPFFRELATVFNAEVPDESKDCIYGEIEHHRERGRRVCDEERQPDCAKADRQAADCCSAG